MDARAEHLVAELARRSAHAVALGEAVSLAARVEPGLLRAARFALVPGADVGAEGDLWLSALVEARGVDGIVLDARVAETLRRRLAADPARLRAAWRVVRAAHRHESPLLRLEELVHRLAAEGSADATRRIDRALTAAVRSLVDADRRGIASWALRALPRFDQRVRELASARLLATAAHFKLTGRVAPGAVPANDALPGWIGLLITPDHPRLTIGVRLTDDAVELGTRAEGDHALDVADTEPLFVEVASGDGGDERLRVVAFERSERVRVPIVGHAARLRTLTGDRYELARRGSAGPRAARRLVVCADGVWNQAAGEGSSRDTPDDDAANGLTNVAKLARAIAPLSGDGTPQIVYYHRAGIGGNVLEKMVGAAFGETISRDTVECYRFLVQNYAPGDEIHLFGFSRGAYTARSLAGMIRNSGLVRAEHGDMIADAERLYRDRDPQAHAAAESTRAFRERYAHSVTIKCVGVWETVGALGVPGGLLDRLAARRYGFHDVTLSSRVENAFHALAIDERRKPFEPSLWQLPAGGEAHSWLEQAWFPGTHSDVGGGYPDSGLSDITLQWMIERVRARTALEFDKSFVDHLRPSLDARPHDPSRVLYRILGDHVREIGASDASPNAPSHGRTCEYVHESAVRLMEHTRGSEHAPYRPENLVRYLERRFPPPRVGTELRPEWLEELRSHHS